ncbi:MAG: prepilin-type N-terminal cleavage/methylation domain-containing protein [Deltaproteobacteria bacterium]|nr:prepilin-type N-terminal cleavage/methylation domain-containing protein [Deltaproteobacteria bacterium]
MVIFKIQLMKCRKGLTLIELLIVIVVVGILAAVAIPTYSGYMVRARRADAKTALEQLRAAQEMRRAERGSYDTDIVALRTTWGGPNSPVGDYNITMVATSTTYTGTATAFTSRQSEDTGVPLTINQDGTKLPAAKWAK